MKQSADSLNLNFHTDVKLNVSEKIKVLFDPGSFVEALSDFENGLNVVTGSGLINGRKTYLIADSPQKQLPADISALPAKKCKFLDIISADPCPIVVLLNSNMILTTASAGMHAPRGLIRVMLGKEGVGGYLSKFSKLSGMVPTVAVLTGDLAAGWTFMGPLCDALVIIDGCRMVLARADAVQKVTGKKVDVATYGGADMHCSETGTADRKAEGDVDAMKWVQQYLSYMPKNYKTSPPHSVASEIKVLPLAVDEEGLFPFQTKRPFEIKNIINSLVDQDSFFEIKELFAMEIVTGFARVAGKTIGIVASNSVHRFGSIFPESCRKITKFASICDSYNIPIVFLADTPGLMLDPDLERASIIKYMSLLISTLGHTTVPKLSVLLRKLFGGGFFALSGPGFADSIIALPNAVAGPWGLSAARAPQSKEEEDGIQEVQDMLDPNKLLQFGYFDQVVEWKDLRKEMIQFLLKSRVAVRDQPKTIVSI